MQKKMLCQNIVIESILWHQTNDLICTLRHDMNSKMMQKLISYRKYSENTAVIRFMIKWFGMEIFFIYKSL